MDSSTVPNAAARATAKPSAPGLLYAATSGGDRRGDFYRLLRLLGGLPVQPALGVIDARAAQDVLRRLGLDHLGHRMGLEFAAQVDQVADHRVVPAGTGQVTDVGPVDLDHIHLELPEIGEGSGAGAEIVQADLVTRLLQG